MTAATFTEENVETALCLWEAVIDGAGLSNPVKDWIKAKREERGTAELRCWIIGLVQGCEAAWVADSAAGKQLEPYDWEHCPAWLDKHIRETELNA